ncbi:MAG: conjugal transfer protein TraO [Bacteroidales bacterium]
MKGIIAISFLLIFLLSEKNSSAQRYIAGMRGVKVNAGITDEVGFFVGGGYSFYTKSKNRWVFGAEYLQNTYEYSFGDVPLSQFTVDMGYYYQFLSDASKTFFLSIGASAMGGYETINWGSKQFSDGTTLINKDKFIYGGAVTLEMEYYLSDQHVLLLNVRERIFGGSTVKTFHTQIGVGLKFILE